MTSASDREVWNEALEREAVIVTKDEDFVTIGRAQPNEPVPAIVWIRIGNCSRKALLESLLPLLPTVVELLEAGERIVEIRSPQTHS